MGYGSGFLTQGRGHARLGRESVNVTILAVLDHGAFREWWEQICGTHHGRVLWSGTMPCRRALSPCPEPGAGDEVRDEVRDEVTRLGAGSLRFELVQSFVMSLGTVVSSNACRSYACCRGNERGVFFG